MIKETIYEIKWSELLKWDIAIKHNKSHHVLYQLCGFHHLYGSNVLLYIGSTLRGQARLKEHEWWINDEYDNVKVKFGSVKKVTDWDKQKYSKGFIKNDKLIRGIESLLILAHQPAYNIKNKNAAPEAEGMRIFNTGKLGQLFPELSYTYFGS
jgi:hypothetical protein